MNAYNIYNSVLGLRAIRSDYGTSLPLSEFADQSGEVTLNAGCDKNTNIVTFCYEGSGAEIRLVLHEYVSNEISNESNELFDVILRLEGDGWSVLDGDGDTMEPERIEQIVEQLDLSAA